MQIVGCQNKYVIKSVYTTGLTKARNLQFRPLQNSEDLHMHYAIGDLEHYDTISPHLSDTYEI